MAHSSDHTQLVGNPESILLLDVPLLDLTKCLIDIDRRVLSFKCRRILYENKLSVKAMSKLVPLREACVYVDESIIDHVPSGFYRLFNMHLCWATELYIKSLYRNVRIPSPGIMSIVLTDQVTNPPTHVPGDHSYRWNFDFLSYNTLTEKEKKQVLFEAVHTGLRWTAEKEHWPTEPFDTAYDNAVENNLVCEGVFKKSWLSPCKKYRTRIRVLHDLEMIEFSAVLYHNRSKAELASLPLGSVRPTRNGFYPYVQDGAWVGPTTFEIRSRSFAQQEWQADFIHEIADKDG